MHSVSGVSLAINKRNPRFPYPTKVISAQNKIWLFTITKEWIPNKPSKYLFHKKLS